MNFETVLACGRCEKIISIHAQKNELKKYFEAKKVAQDRGIAPDSVGTILLPVDIKNAFSEEKRFTQKDIKEIV
ncbi:hypothetical protein BB559_002537 [Furculomyces boomerangus]|uniref:Uncharacterized protein n=2 Tax=Harpellales TaxID=61421 RepID=A0A2T9YUJ8_9FUNG|nr:hypothetical protein BB559_002537 [Furculomyces boomerangus]PVZ97585.1 hypothetical protein BB558_006451 [Smittium angustum]